MVTTVSQPLSVSKLAQMLGVNRQRVYNLIYSGQLKTEPTSNGYVILPEECNRFITGRLETVNANGATSITFAGVSSVKQLRGSGPPRHTQRKSGYRRGVSSVSSPTRHGSDAGEPELV